MNLKSAKEEELTSDLQIAYSQIPRMSKQDDEEFEEDLINQIHNNFQEP